MGKFLKQMRWLKCQQTSLVGVELQRNGQPSFCRPKVNLEVKSLVILVSARWLHGRLLGLLITFSGLKQKRIKSYTTVPCDKDNRKHRSTKLHVPRFCLSPVLVVVFQLSRLKTDTTLIHKTIAYYILLNVYAERK